MTNSDKDKEFNATLRRLIKQKPKPHDEMKKGSRSGAKRVRKNSPKSGISLQALEKGCSIRGCTFEGETAAIHIATDK